MHYAVVEVRHGRPNEPSPADLWPTLIEALQESDAPSRHSTIWAIDEDGHMSALDINISGRYGCTVHLRRDGSSPVSGQDRSVPKALQSCLSKYPLEHPSFHPEALALLCGVAVHFGAIGQDFADAVLAASAEWCRQKQALEASSAGYQELLANLPSSRQLVG